MHITALLRANIDLHLEELSNYRTNHWVPHFLTLLQEMNHTSKLTLLDLTDLNIDIYTGICVQI